MPSNYDAIREGNIKRRGEEFDDIGKLVAEQLYADRTHFIYELLQNAEDALQRRRRAEPDQGYPGSVAFRLYPDRLEVRHYGKPFCEDDVRAITDILNGTKKEDQAQIGRFGIGFKSIYAFTASPEIHSSDEHFRIERYIRPHPVAPRPLADGETLFIFPFDHANLSPAATFAMIEERLRNLGPRTLLFLRCIEEIEWVIEGGSQGGYLRESCVERADLPLRQVTVVGQSDAGDHQEEAEEWLVLERPIDVPGGGATSSVEIAYRLTTDARSGRREIAPLEDSRLHAFFPTEKETHTGFLMQGPYVTTGARDNIARDGTEGDWNRFLIRESAALAAASLRVLKEIGLLSVRALEAVPLQAARFPEDTSGNSRSADAIFRPIFEDVREALRVEPLLPAYGGGYVEGWRGMLARGADLRRLLTNEQLQALYRSEEPVCWLAEEITEVRTPILRSYLISELGVREVAPQDFARRFDGAFIEQQTDEWVAGLYAYLSGQRALWGLGGDLRYEPLIRLENNQHVPPFGTDRMPCAYLPPPVGETSFPTVKRCIAQQADAAEFLRNLGLSEPDIVDEVLKVVLPKYADRGSLLESDPRHEADVNKILRALDAVDWHRRASLIQQVESTAFLWSVNAVTGEERLKRPDQVYLPGPDLSLYFDGNRDVWFLDERYARLYGALEQLDVARQVRVRSSKPDASGNVRLWRERGFHERGVDGFDPDAEIDGLEHALQQITAEKAIYVWNRLLAPRPQLVRGIIETCSRKSFDRPERSSPQLSRIGKMISSAVWLPGPDGAFLRPADLFLEDLPEEFARSEALAAALSMRASEERILATRLGLEAGDLDLLKAHPEEFAQWKSSLLAKAGRTEENSRGTPSEVVGENSLIPPDGRAPYDRRLPQTPTVSINEHYLIEKFPGARVEYWDNGANGSSSSRQSAGELENEPCLPPNTGRAYLLARSFEDGMLWLERPEPAALFPAREGKQDAAGKWFFTAYLQPDTEQGPRLQLRVDPERRILHFPRLDDQRRVIDFLADEGLHPGCELRIERMENVGHRIGYESCETRVPRVPVIGLDPASGKPVVHMLPEGLILPGRCNRRLLLGQQRFADEGARRALLAMADGAPDILRALIGLLEGRTEPIDREDLYLLNFQIRPVSYGYFEQVLDRNSGDGRLFRVTEDGRIRMSDGVPSLISLPKLVREPHKFDWEAFRQELRRLFAELALNDAEALVGSVVETCKQCLRRNPT